MGIILSLIVAVLASFQAIYLKKATLSNNTLQTAFAMYFFALPLLLPILLLSGIPQLSSTFWSVSIIQIILEIVATVLVIKSLKYEDVSLVVPLSAFTIIVVVLVSTMLNNEFPTRVGLLGIMLISFGSYTLNSKKEDLNLLSPVKNVFLNKGTRYMLIAAVIYGFTPSFAKIAITNSDPTFYAVFISTALTASFLLLLIKSSPKSIPKSFQPKKLKQLAPLGLLFGLIVLLQYAALDLTLNAYVASIKRSSIAISAILAYLIFKEDIKDRIGPILIMLAGVIMIATS